MHSDCSTAPKKRGPRPKPPIMAKCELCGAEYSYTTKRSRAHKYCSLHCSASANYHNLGESAVAATFVPCEQCGVSYKLKKGSTRGRFCSRKCFGRWQSAHVVGEAHPRRGKSFGRPKGLPAPLTRPCEACGSAFTYKASHAARARFCSRKCSGPVTAAAGRAAREAACAAAAVLRVRNCVICGEPFVPEPCRANKRKVCSKRCGYDLATQRAGADHWHWKGGRVRDYGSSWPWARRKALKRDKVCQECGKTREENGRSLSVHHIVAFKQFGLDRHREANALANLTVLCNPCHMRREWNEGELAIAPNRRNKGQKKNPPKS